MTPECPCSELHFPQFRRQAVSRLDSHHLPIRLAWPPCPHLLPWAFPAGPGQPVSPALPLWLWQASHKARVPYWLWHSVFLSPVLSPWTAGKEAWERLEGPSSAPAVLGVLVGLAPAEAWPEAPALSARPLLPRCRCAMAAWCGALNLTSSMVRTPNTAGTGQGCSPLRSLSEPRSHGLGLQASFKSHSLPS